MHLVIFMSLTDFDAKSETEVSITKEGKQYLEQMHCDGHILVVII